MTNPKIASIIGSNADIALQEHLIDSSPFIEASNLPQPNKVLVNQVGGAFGVPSTGDGLWLSFSDPVALEPYHASGSPRGSFTKRARSST